MESMPANIGVEQALLGALIFDNRQIDLVSDRLSELSFYGDQHVIIWRALLEIRQSNGLADANTLLEFFQKDDSLKKIGGEEYLANMVSARALEIEIEDYAGILVDVENRRALIQMAQKIESMAIKPGASQSASEIATDAQSTLSGIMLGTTVKPPIQILQGAKSYIQRIREAKLSGEIPYLKTNIPNLDRRLGGGFFAPDLVTLAGRPSMGKTLTAIAIMDGVARGPSLKKEANGANASVLFHSLEMSADQIIARNMTLNTHMHYGKRFSSRNMRNNKIKDEHLDLLEKHSELIGDIHIDDRSMVKLRDIKIRALDHIRRVGYLDFIVIDYLTIMGHEADDIKRGLNYAVGVITAGLKRLAKELNIPILLLAQLSRGVDHREVKIPMLADLRDSGTIEQDSDIVIFTYRERYYVEKNEPQPGVKNYQELHDSWTLNMRRTEFLLQLFFAKQRLGPVGDDKYWCDSGLGSRNRQKRKQSTTNI